MQLRIHGRRVGTAPRHVLITRLSAIGDCILTIPVAVEAKRLWPNCRLTWAVDCAAEQLLQDHPCIDEVLRIEKGWIKRPSGWGDLRRELRSRDFDVVLDPQGLTKSAALGWLSGAPTRVGFDFSHARELAPLFANRRVHREQRHMVDTYLQVLSPWVNCLAGSGEFALPVYREAAESVEQMLRELNLTSSSNWVGMNPGAGWTTRQWPVERFGQLARAIFEQHGRRSLVFWAGQDERLMANVIAEESNGAASLAPATSLRELVELIRRTSLLVTGDTGPLHMASAVGTPAVSLHGPTWADESGPYGNHHVAVQSRTPLLSKKLVRHGPNLAMQAIELDEVVRACNRLFSASAAARTAA
ncbi:MAG: glycosyltransferase family 9 protein [Pirellulaceae bacterium]